VGGEPFWKKDSALHECGKEIKKKKAIGGEPILWLGTSGKNERQCSWRVVRSSNPEMGAKKRRRKRVPLGEKSPWEKFPETFKNLYIEMVDCPGRVNSHFWTPPKDSHEKKGVFGTGGKKFEKKMSCGSRTQEDVNHTGKG